MEVDEPVTSANVSTIQEKLAAIAKEEVLDLDYEEPLEQEESDSGEIPDSPVQSPSKTNTKENSVTPEKEEGELEEGEITDSEDEGEIRSTGEELLSRGKIPITSRLSRPNTTVTSLRKEGGSRRRKNRNNRNKLERNNETAWERTLRSAREALTRDSETKDDYIRANSRSSSPESCQIPSLLDLQMSPPLKFTSPRVPPKDLGPQVIYPNGRPVRAKNEKPRQTSRKNSPKLSPKRSPSKRRRDSPEYKDSPPAKRQGFSPVRDASPISSDSDSWTRDENFESKKKAGKPANVSSEIADPWAREKASNKREIEKKKRSRSFSRSCSSSSASGASDRSVSRSSSSSSDTRKKNKTKSPPRGDISYYRIPKKARQSAGSDTSNRRSRNDSRNPSRSEFNNSNKYDRLKNKRSSPQQAQKISDSESDSERSKKRSSSGSASSRSSISRSSSPALPAKYRVNVSKPRSASPISDDDDDDSHKSVSPVRKPVVKHKYVPDPVAVSPISDDSPEPEERSKSKTPPIAQPRNASKPWPITPRTPSGSPPPSSPPARQMKDEKIDIAQAEKNRKKQELQEQLKMIEAELERKRASQASSS